MRRALSCLPLALLLIANVVPSKAQSVETTAAPAEATAVDADADNEAGPIVYYDLFRSVALNCTLDNASKLPYVWSKNGSAITEYPELKEHLKLSSGGAVLELPRAVEEDWGNYSCSVGPALQAWRLHARVFTRLPAANTNVVEGQKLRLVCKVVGRPAPRVEWRYNESLAEPGSATAPAAGALGADRVTVRDSDAGVPDGELLLDAARRSDAGSYVCAPLAAEGALATAVPFGHTTLRVKDMYAALWPFLGICAEVLVLCAVILVYEKRRTKPELDDSDTDNHDQKKS